MGEDTDLHWGKEERFKPEGEEKKWTRINLIDGLPTLDKL